MSRPQAGSRLRLRAVAFVETPADAAGAASETIFESVASHGGEPIQRVQRLVIAAFDSARRALEFAAQLPAGVRAGLSIGDVLYEGDAVHGLPVVLASRLREQADFGEVLCVAPLITLAPEAASAFCLAGERRLAGFAEDIAVFERVSR
ncbi:MAG: hypothetical protein FJ091_08950 [Deltaproteobacteria bacterium]|nr:hypothetical protein [Deltaproteobacteria bacterium]